VTETERATATAFARRMLESRLQGPVKAIYEVSAIERLENRGPRRDWDRFIADLQKLAEESGESLTLAAKNRGLRRIAGQLFGILREEREALLRPLQESERRISAMRTTITDAERSLNELSYLFIAEQHRLSRIFADRRAEFLNKAQPMARGELAAALRSITRGSGPRFRREAMRLAQDIARKHVAPWLAGEQAYAAQAFRSAAQRFVDIGNDFLRRLAEARVPELAAMPRPLDAEQGFRTRSRFYFHEFITIAQPASPLRWLADLLLGVVAAYGSLERDAREFLDRLLESNSMRVQSDVDTRVGDGKSRLETDVRILLREVAAVAERALAHARATREGGAAGIEAALARIEATESEIHTLTNEAPSPLPNG